MPQLTGNEGFKIADDAPTISISDQFLNRIDLIEKDIKNLIEWQNQDQTNLLNLTKDVIMIGNQLKKFMLSVMK